MVRDDVCGPVGERVPYGVRLGPNAGAPQRVGLVVGGLPLLLGLQAELPHGLVNRHVVGQQVVADVELQSVAHAAGVQELSRLGMGSMRRIP